MQVNIKRTEHDNVQGTRGNVYFNGKFIGHSIECPKLYNTPYLSRIPAGTYIAKRDISPKYGSAFYIQNVPGRTLIVLFHKGNTKEDFQGCIGLGRRMTIMDGQNAVTDTRAVCNEFKRLVEDVKQLTVVIEDV